MTKKVVDDISDRYIELFEKITGEKFIAGSSDEVLPRIERNVLDFLTGL
jgi:phosphoribosylaminoimidazole-succinocarboxamide synthase